MQWSWGELWRWVVSLWACYYEPTYLDDMTIIWSSLSIIKYELAKL